MVVVSVDLVTLTQAENSHSIEVLEARRASQNLLLSWSRWWWCGRFDQAPFSRCLPGRTYLGSGGCWSLRSSGAGQGIVERVAQTTTGQWTDSPTPGGR